MQRLQLLGTASEFATSLAVNSFPSCPQLAAICNNVFAHCLLGKALKQCLDVGCWTIPVYWYKLTIVDLDASANAIN